MPDLVRRQLALEATRRRFAKRRRELGRNDCAILTRFHLRAMGHRNMPALGQYRTPRQAIGALKRVAASVGAAEATIEGIVDVLLERIPPAAMRPGDIALVDEEEAGVGGGALVISLGTKFWGWHPDAEEFAVIEPNGMPFRAAWRA